MKIINNDEAVSPVIGVILMVAITVILAAVIAAFVFGLAGSTGTAKNVGMTIAQNSSGVAYVTIQGGTDLPSMNDLAYTLNGSGGTPTNMVQASGAALTYPLTVGQTVFTAVDEDVTGSRVTIIGKFSDGSTQVMLDKQF